MVATRQIKLMGKSYKVRCSDTEEQALDASVAMLERELAYANQRSGLSSREDIILMAALNLSHRLIEVAAKEASSMPLAAKKVTGTP